ncbi:aldose 1-epimerase family protein [Gottfriedia acidiceleris]|uniref:Aldose 1-epimerase family protein n=1 Tax=Gottfriedia acidiceleris TaxID=371036 RepID=A0ABY4JP94_9BACI|nr:aldose 1-epimerase family protein [Gottfriedia acidiceleris]UPM55089.1 aldose 1-epimerase family protein [Gottfriedia acidiceleris]
MSYIENEFIKITTKSKGAELTGIYTKKDNLNYLWNADPAYWGRHAPVLFPNVGKLIDNKYKVDNKVYELSQHGFARDMDFQLTEMKEDYINYELMSSEQTLLKYPFEFSLNINYKIRNNTVFIKYVVTNKDQKSMPFSIGAHPAFNIPLKEDETFKDYYLQFEEEERLETIKLEGSYRNGKRELIGQNIKNLPLTRELFKDDALIFEKLKKNELTIRSKNHSNKIKVHFEGFPYVGIWTTQKAPFLCIEPWYGIADEIGPIKEMKNRLGIQMLNPSETFTCTYSITVENG